MLYYSRVIFKCHNTYERLCTYMYDGLIIDDAEKSTNLISELQFGRQLINICIRADVRLMRARRIDAVNIFERIYKQLGGEGFCLHKIRSCWRCTCTTVPSGFANVSSNLEKRSKVSLLLLSIALMNRYTESSYKRKLSNSLRKGCKLLRELEELKNFWSRK